MTDDTNKTTLRSRIKNTFSEELLKLIANICDTKRIDSSQRKMKMLQQLLKRYEIRFDVLGGATNRIALFIDGYAFKFAMDRQGYKDNWMEYALSAELQPYVTKVYETNGYILVAEPVKTMTIDDFRLRKVDILKVLEILSSDYLLGDVGYIKKNFTNWGIRDNGNVVILDFAYCHRGTEKLFTCQVCGEGMLRYDSTFSHLKCSNSTVCMTKYTYNEIKMIQGDQVDIDMIDEMKSQSITLGHGESTKKIFVNDGKIVDGDKPVIKSFNDYIKYVKEVKYMFGTNFNQTEAADLMVERMKTKNPQRIAEIDAQILELIGETDSTDPINSTNPDDELVDVVIIDDDEPVVEDEECPSDIDVAPHMDEMVAIIKGEIPNTIATMPQETPVEDVPEPEATTTNEDLPNGVVVDTVPEEMYSNEDEEDDDYIDPLDIQIALLRQRRMNRGPVGSVVGDGEFMEYHPTTRNIGDEF